MYHTTIDLSQLAPREAYPFLVGTVAPRPIALVSSMNSAGEVNLAPFSYFNVFSAQPPMLVFSPAYSGRTGLPKDTLNNVRQVPQVVINMVNYNMVQQISLASSEYPPHVNEFVKAGFTPLASVRVQPPRVAESPIQFECSVTDIIELGKQGGAGNLVLCRIDLLHIGSHLLNEHGKPDQQKLDLVARLGDNYYSRNFGSALFEVHKPTAAGVGIDALPAHIRFSHLLSGNELGQMGSLTQLPTTDQIAQARNGAAVQHICQHTPADQLPAALFAHAQSLLAAQQTAEALAVLMSLA